MAAKPQSELPAEPWRSFLADLDPLLDQPTDLHCIGGFAISRARLHGLEASQCPLMN